MTHSKHVYCKHLRSSTLHVLDLKVFINVTFIAYAAFLVRYEQTEKDKASDVC